MEDTRKRFWEIAYKYPNEGTALFYARRLYRKGRLNSVLVAYVEQNSDRNGSPSISIYLPQGGSLEIDIYKKVTKESLLNLYLDLYLIPNIENEIFDFLRTFGQNEIELVIRSMIEHPYTPYMLVEYFGDGYRKGEISDSQLAMFLSSISPKYTYGRTVLDIELQMTVVFAALIVTKVLPLDSVVYGRASDNVVLAIFNLFDSESTYDRPTHSVNDDSVITCMMFGAYEISDERVDGVVKELYRSGKTCEYLLGLYFDASKYVPPIPRLTRGKRLIEDAIIMNCKDEEGQFRSLQSYLMNDEYFLRYNALMSERRENV